MLGQREVRDALLGAFPELEPATADAEFVLLVPVKIHRDVIGFLSILMGDVVYIRGRDLMMYQPDHDLHTAFVWYRNSKESWVIDIYEIPE